MNAFWLAIAPILGQVWTILVLFYPIWLPILLITIFWQTWVTYIRTLAWSKQKYALLEIRLPRELMKSPRAMEVVINALYNTGGEGNFFARYWKGGTRPSYSLELVSDGGHVRFLIWTRENSRNFIESQIYAQYPEVEIHQVEDYVSKVEYQPGVNAMWGCRFELAAANPLPIVSYVDYGLDLSENPKEEFKIDPISQTLELLSSTKPGEHIWLQIIIRAHKSEKREGLLSKKTDWRSDIRKIRDELFKKIKEDNRMVPLDNERTLLGALSRSYQKYPFDCGIRGIYFADSADAFNKAAIGTVRELLRPFSYSAASFKKAFDTDTLAGFNGFKVSGGTDFDFPWEDFKNWRADKMKREILNRYKRRSFFYSPFQDKTFVLTSESLATIFHFPGATAAAPGLERIPSKRAQAPSNIPI